jgi:hypothetical protein
MNDVTVTKSVISGIIPWTTRQIFVIARMLSVWQLTVLALHVTICPSPDKVPDHVFDIGRLVQLLEKP